MTDIFDEAAHWKPLTESNHETAKLLASGQILGEEYFPFGELPEGTTKGKGKEIKQIKRYLDLEGDSRLLDLYQRFGYFMTEIVMNMKSYLDVDQDFIDYEKIDGLLQASNNLLLSREKIDHFREDVGRHYIGKIAFMEVVAELRGWLLTLLQLMPKDKVMALVKSTFYQAVAQLLTDYDRDIPSTILFKLDKARRDSLSKTNPDFALALARIERVEEMRRRTDDITQSSAHPKFAERATALMPGQVRSEESSMNESFDAEMQDSISRFMSEFDFEDLSGILEAIMGLNHKEVFDIESHNK
jgi:hypothetical protein